VGGNLIYDPACWPGLPPSRRDYQEQLSRSGTAYNLRFRMGCAQRHCGAGTCALEWGVAYAVGCRTTSLLCLPALRVGSISLLGFYCRHPWHGGRGLVCSPFSASAGICRAGSHGQCCWSALFATPRNGSRGPGAGCAQTGRTAGTLAPVPRRRRRLSDPPDDELPESRRQVQFVGPVL